MLYVYTWFVLVQLQKKLKNKNCAHLKLFFTVLLDIFTIILNIFAMEGHYDHLPLACL